MSISPIYSNCGQPYKEILQLEAHNTLMRTTLELALECFEMNGLGKGYVMDVIRDTLREVAGGEE